MLSHIEILAENGSLSCQRIESDHLKVALSNLPSGAYLAVKSGIEGSDGVSDNAAVLEPTEEATSYIPIFNTFLSDFEMPVSGFQSPVIVRVWWKTGSFINNALKQSITSASMLVDQWVYDSSVRAKNITKFQTQKLDFRFGSTRFQRSLETVPSNQMFNLRLSSLHGLITSMVVILKDAAGNVCPIKKLDLLDSSGASLLGGSPIEHAYLQTIQRPREGRYVPTSVEPDVESNKFFHVPISQEAAAHNSEGTINGYIPQSGHHQISFYYETASDSTTSMEITVLYTAVSTFTVDKGVCSVQHS